MRAPLLAGLTALLLAAAAPAFAAGEDCARCHACPQPTPREPCLRTCPRPDPLASVARSALPDVVILDDLVDLYVPVRFAHRAHAQMSDLDAGCATCHHHTPPGDPHPACRNCHPREVIHEDLAQPGLKGAYHRQCLNCHTEWDRDVSCEVCHEKRAGGPLHGSGMGANPHSTRKPVAMQSVILFETNYRGGDRVPFHHRNHSELYESDCAACHREQSCSSCHVQDRVLHPMGEPSRVDLHDTCFRCHRPERDPCHPANSCLHCHGRKPDDVFEHRAVGWELKRYHARLTCGVCHGSWTAGGRPERDCASCHPEGFERAGFRHETVGVALDATHAEASCDDCHAAGFGPPPGCGGCHDDGRVFQARTGFSPPGGAP